jgi:hypothetical protein
MFFGAPITSDYFFNGDRPIVRLRKSKSLPHKKDVASKATRVSMSLLEGTYNRLEWYRLHHNIDSYTKSAFLDTLARYHDSFVLTYGNQFRTEHDVHRVIFGLDAVYADKADLEIVKHPSIFERKVLSLFKKVTWDNLIGNAIKFSPEGGLIELRLLEQKECVVFTVRDQGCGMNAEVRDRIFEKFYQGDPSHKQWGMA